MRSSLISPLIAGGLLCLGGLAQAQQQESRINQILKPDPNRKFDFYEKAARSKSFYTPAEGKVIEGKAVGVRKFNSSEYLTGAFHGQKSSWLGDFKYNMEEKNNSRFLFIFPSKSFLTKEANAAGKDYTGVKKYNDASLTASTTRDYRGSGAFQGHREGDKLKKNLSPDLKELPNSYGDGFKELKSIDDVRALLNKN